MFGIGGVAGEVGERRRLLLRRPVLLNDDRAAAAERCQRRQGRQRPAEDESFAAGFGVALLQGVEADAEEAGGELQERAGLAVALRTGIGADGLERHVGKLAVWADGEAKGRGEAFGGGVEGRLVGGVGFAIDDDGEDLVLAAHALEGENFLVHPVRRRRARRTDDDEELRRGEGGGDLAAKIGAAGQLFAITKDRVEAFGNGAGGDGWHSDQLGGHAVGLERLVQPVGPPLVGVAVADEGPIPDRRHPGGVGHCRLRPPPRGPESQAR